MRRRLADALLVLQKPAFARAPLPCTPKHLLAFTTQFGHSHAAQWIHGMMHGPPPSTRLPWAAPENRPALSPCACCPSTGAILGMFGAALRTLSGRAYSSDGLKGSLWWQEKGPGRRQRIGPTFHSAHAAADRALLCLPASGKDLPGPMASPQASRWIERTAVQRAEGCHALCEDPPPRKCKEDRALPRLPRKRERHFRSSAFILSFHIDSKIVEPCAEGYHALIKDPSPPFAVAMSRQCAPVVRPCGSTQGTRCHLWCRYTIRSSLNTGHG